MSVANQNFSRAKRDAGPGGALAFAALLAGNAALAIGPLFVRQADVGPVASGFWRLALALPVLAALAWWQARRAPAGAASLIHDRRALTLALVGGLFFAGDLASWHLGILATKMANATLFGNAASLVLPVVTLVAARRLPVRVEALALVCAATGALVLMRESSQAGTARLVGDLLCLTAGLLYAFYVLAMQRARAAIGSWATLALATATGALPLLAAALLLGEPVWPGDWRPLLLLALSSQIVGQGLLILSLPHFSALVIGLTLLSQPAVAALVGWLVYGEAFTTADWTGSVLVALALVLIRLPTARTP